MNNAKHCNLNSYFKNVSGRPISNISTNNTSYKRGNGSNRNNNWKKNNNRSQQNNNSNSNHSNNGFLCNGGCGGRGKDRRDNDENKKKRDNDSNQGQNLDKKEKNEEKKDVKLNVNAPQFVPNCISIPSPLQRKKSGILILDTIDEDEKEEKDSKIITAKRFPRSKWDPFPIKCAGTVHIPSHLTQNIIPSIIKENIQNVNYFMDKSMALTANKTMLKNDDFVIINYDFHHKDTAESLYCIIQQQCSVKHNEFNWIMMDRLFTKNEILIEFNFSEKQLLLPLSSRFDSKYIQQIDCIHSIHDILETQLIFGIVERTQWHRIPIYNKTNNKHRKVFYLTKHEFMKKIEYFSTNNRNTNIMPIMILNSNKEYWIEHIYIIKIDENIHIGISMKYKPHRNRVEVTGIHLNKQYIRDKHQLAVPNHYCQCLDDFKSDIDDLKIGNIDQDKNRIKDLQKRHEIIKNENNMIKKENKRLNELVKESNVHNEDKNKSAFYKKKYSKLKRFVKRFSNQKSPILQLLAEAKDHLDSDDDDVPEYVSSIPMTQPSLHMNTTNMYDPSLSIPTTPLYISMPIMPISQQSSSSLLSLSSIISPTPSAAAGAAGTVQTFYFPLNDSNHYGQ